MKKRKKITPRWLSIVRKFHTYLGDIAIISGTGTYLGWDDSTTLFVIGWYRAFGMLIQIICDVSYAKDPLQDMPAEPKNIKE